MKQSRGMATAFHTFSLAGAKGSDSHSLIGTPSLAPCRQSQQEQYPAQTPPF